MLFIWINYLSLYPLLIFLAMISITDVPCLYKLLVVSLVSIVTYVACRYCTKRACYLHRTDSKPFCMLVLTEQLISYVFPSVISLMAFKIMIHLNAKVVIKCLVH